MVASGLQPRGSDLFYEECIWESGWLCLVAELEDYIFDLMAIFTGEGIVTQKTYMFT